MKTAQRIGVIGTSWAAKSPLPTFASHPRTRVFGICSARRTRAEDAAAVFGASFACDDYRKLIEHPEVDAVYIGSPVGLHKEMALAAIATGKPVLCEKPLARNALEAEVMLQAAQTKGIAHATAFTMRNFAFADTVHRHLGQGFVGAIRQVAVTLFMGFPGFEAMPWTWLSDLDHGGGSLNALGSHYIDLIRYWCGDFASVSGKTQVWVKERKDDSGAMKAVTADDAFVLSGRLESGALVTIHLSAAAVASPPARIEIIGSVGSIVVTGTDRVEVSSPGERELKPVEVKDPAWSEDTAKCAVPRFGAIVEAWLDDALSHSRVLTHPTFVDGLAVQRVIDALRAGG